MISCVGVLCEAHGHSNTLSPFGQIHSSGDSCGITGKGSQQIGESANTQCRNLAGSRLALSIGQGTSLVVHSNRARFAISWNRGVSDEDRSATR